LISFAFGIGLTALVQSSSVTTSLMVPFIGSGMITVEQIFPYVLGANIGTTITAILASLVTNSTAAVAVAFVHLLFNIAGIIIVYPFRKVPISLAKRLGKFVSEKRSLAILYMIGTFYILPIIILILYGII
jgi:sodium-dependent phosphate cotransporter